MGCALADKPRRDDLPVGSSATHVHTSPKPDVPPRPPGGSSSFAWQNEKILSALNPLQTTSSRTDKSW